MKSVTVHVPATTANLGRASTRSGWRWTCGTKLNFPRRAPGASR